MKFAFFLGCTTPSHLQEYEASSRAVLNRLGITLVDIPQFNCCGYPLKNMDMQASLLSTARNLALAEKENLNILSLCKCGYGTFKQAVDALGKDPAMREEINRFLEKEGLSYNGTCDIFHLLTVLHRHVGLDKIKKHVSTSFKDLKIATHYGCHALRPSEIVQFDDPVAPQIFDDLVTATGADSIAWAEKLACCGSPLSGTNDTLSFDFAEKKMASAKQAGAHFIATACPFCQIQFKSVHVEMPNSGADTDVPPVLYSQLLGFCMGIDRNSLGLNNRDGDTLERFMENQ